MRDQLNKIKQDIIAELKRTKTLDQLESIHNKYFSRQTGEFSKLIKDVKNVAQDQRPIIGKLANEIKAEAEKLFTEIKSQITKKDSDEKSNVSSQMSNVNFDTTLPGKKQSIGKLHPLTQVRRDVETVFHKMGFIVVDGPELESDWYNFEAINIPATHPARDMQDTFYVKAKNKNSQLVMRTHTSNVQVRAMEKYGAPLKCIAPGRVFRNEATDARHEHTFHQVEGLMVDTNISIANLKATIAEIIHAILGENYKVRFRPGYFPFVEPGLEIDLSCALCTGKGCRICKGTGWVEFMGAGMVHPNVIRAGGLDSNKYTGFAFGFGLERIIMMKYGIDDIRLFHSSDLRFLEQF